MFKGIENLDFPQLSQLMQRPVRIQSQIFTQYSFWFICHKENRHVYAPAAQHKAWAQMKRKTANKDVQ